MAVRDQLERVAAWFGFGVDEDDYYGDEEEDKNRRVKDPYANGARNREAEPSPAVRRLGRAERSSAFGTSLGDLFGSEGDSGQRYGSSGYGSSGYGSSDNSPHSGRSRTSARRR